MIHEYKNDRWLPGDPQRDGSQPFPDHPASGVFFNDVTGAQGASADAVAEDLPQLLMKQGALADLLPAPRDWPGLMNRLKGAVYASHATEVLTRLIAEVTLGRDESVRVQPVDRWSPALADEATQMALALVRANGQMAYIRRQPWFQSGTHEVVLMVETEIDRPQTRLNWHKDTIGHALFSNLVFRNEDGFLGTEWTPDPMPMPEDKRTLVASHWPPALLSAIDDARGQLAQNGGRGLAIEGGTLPANGYVAWVDELLWHSTPVLQHRFHWTAADVETVLNDTEFNMATYDLMAQIAQTPGSRFEDWLADLNDEPHELSLEWSRKLWDEAREDAEGLAMLKLLRQDAQDIDWSQRAGTTAYGVSLIQELEDDVQVMTIQPTGIVGRPRRNSADMDALQASPASSQRRDFMQVVVTVRQAR